MTQKRLVIRKPDDMHAHLRDKEMLDAVLPDTVRHFARAIVMPNLVPAVRTVAQARDYAARITRANARAAEHSFTPLMTLYLTEETPVEEVKLAKESGFIHGFKYYPHGATTNSSEGVRSFENVRAQLAMMQECGMPLLLHGEITHQEGKSVDPFYRERRFVETTLPWLRKNYPELKMVLEHITSLEAARYITEYGGNTLAATITPHHLVADRRALFEGGLNPHFYCLPILKEEPDLMALRALATRGLPCVFAGTDTAPHPTHAKERACGCAAGCFVAPIALSMYAQVFDEMGALHNLEAFLSENGATWYGLPLNEETITLVREDVPVTVEKLVPVSSGSRWSGDDQNVRVFGIHDDPDKSLKWNWRVE